MGIDFNSLGDLSSLRLDFTTVEPEEITYAEDGSVSSRTPGGQTGLVISGAGDTVNTSLGDIVSNLYMLKRGYFVVGWNADGEIVSRFSSRAVADEQGSGVPPSAPVYITNSSAKTTIFSRVMVGGALGTDGFIDLRFPFVYLNNTGGGKTITWTVEFGSTTLFSVATNNITAGSNRRTCEVWFRLWNISSASVQRAAIYWDIGSTAAAAAVVAKGSDSQAGYNTGAVDTSVDQLLTLSATLNSADTTHEVYFAGAIVNGPYNL